MPVPACAAPRHATASAPSPTAPGAAGRPRIESFEPIEPPWQAIRQWIPADDDEPVFERFDTHLSNESTWKPAEIPLDDDRILVLDAD